MNTRASLTQRLMDFQRQMLEFHRAALDNTFSTATALQERQESILRRLIDATPLLPPETLDTVDVWLEEVAKGRGELQQTAEFTFDKIEELLDRVESRAGSSANTDAAGSKGKRGDS